jgi:hypothetical protein
MTRRSRGLLMHGKIAPLTVALALFAGACGSSQPTADGADVTLASTTTSVSDAWPLAYHVITPAVLPGFVRTRPPMISSSSSAWATMERSTHPRREAARLGELGFVRAIDEQLHARFPLSAAAVSIAEQYRSPLGARTELAHQYRQLENSRGVKVSTFRVGIPDAYGVGVIGGRMSALKVLFSAGPYYYVVATDYPSNAHHAPTATQLLAATRTLYLAMTGCSAPGPAAHTD